MTLGNIPLTTSDLQLNYGARRNSTLICAPIMAESVDQMLDQMQKAKKVGADIIEIRMDFLQNFSPRQDLEILIKQSPLPTLVTYRPVWEGGQYDGNESKRQDALRAALEVGADYIDIELKKSLKHYSLVFDAIYTPKLTRLLREAQECGATVVYGTEMFINQAFVQFERFSGLPGKMKFKQKFPLLFFRKVSWTIGHYLPLGCITLYPM